MVELNGSDRSPSSSSSRSSSSLIHHPKTNFLLPIFHRRTLMDAISIVVPNLPLPTGYKIISRSSERSNRHRLISSSSRSRSRSRISAVDEVTAVTFDPAAPQITWQIIVGSIAGVTPFVAAGIEFSKRIVAQKICGECGGSGLVLIEKEYVRCPNCGGFLPWQSWRRFFTGRNLQVMFRLNDLTCHPTPYNIGTIDYQTLIAAPKIISTMPTI